MKELNPKIKDRHAVYGVCHVLLGLKRAKTGIPKRQCLVTFKV